MSLKFIGDRKGMYIYPWYISDITSTRDIAKVAGMNIEECFMVFHEDFLSFYYDVESSEKVGQILFKRLLEEKGFFEETVKNIYAYAEALLTFCRECQEIDLKNLDRDGLFDLYERYTEKLIQVRIWGWIPVFVDGFTEPYLSDDLLARLRTHLEKTGRAEKAPEFFSLLTSSERESEVQKEEIARLRLALHRKEMSEAEIESAFAEHVKEFGSLTYAYSGPPMSIPYLRSMVDADMNKAGLEERIEKIKDHFATIAAEKKRIYEEFAIPEDLQFGFRIASELMYMKDWRKGAYQQAYLLMDDVLSEIAGRINWSLKEFKYLTLDEARSVFLKNEGELYKVRVMKRLKHCCYVAKAGEITVYEGDACASVEAEKLAHLKKDEKQEEVTELKGQIAFSGIVRGTVRIVLTVEDMPKMMDGDVLVSSATNPDLISAMKKASAFVTDLGGITSHASIVSREMKIPCIVGTRIATKVLKDGDEVEVDAERGIVKVLKRHVE